MGERVTGSHEVRGSNPLFSTTQCQDSGFIPESFLFRFSSCLGRSHPKSTNDALQTPPNVDLGWERRRAPEITVKISLVANHNRLVWMPSGCSSRKAWTTRAAPSWRGSSKPVETERHQGGEKGARSVLEAFSRGSICRSPNSPRSVSS